MDIEARKRANGGYVHGEAFMLMWYECEECFHRERIWNSRDGVTPFGITCPSCGKIANHAQWHLDERAPEHKLHYGQRFFRDGTPDEAERFMRERIDKARGTEYEASPEMAAQLIAAARSGNERASEFQKGWPMLDRRQDQERA